MRGTLCCVSENQLIDAAVAEVNFAEPAQGLRYIVRRLLHRISRSAACRGFTLFDVAFESVQMHCGDLESRASSILLPFIAAEHNSSREWFADKFLN